MLDNTLTSNGVLKLDLTPLASTTVDSCAFYKLKTSLVPESYAESELIKGTYLNNACHPSASILSNTAYMMVLKCSTVEIEGVYGPIGLTTRAFDD